MKYLITIIFAFLLACNSQPKEATAKQESRQTEAKDSSSSNCYRYAGNGDTISLRVTHIGDSITGTLVYNLKEKDRNNGTIQGHMKNNILLADYTFLSEGMQSVRQVAFKLEGNSFIEGYGDIVNDKDIMKFKDSKLLSFSSTVKLAEIACQ